MGLTKRGVVLASVSALVLVPGAPTVQAQQAQPEIRFVTVTTFQVPFSEDRQKVVWWIDSVMVPQVRMNPNVLSYRVATHRWGHTAADIVMIAEYPSWAAIEGECEACSEWLEQRRPAEGTPEREEWDATAAVFFKYYTSHSDEIYTANMRRAKQ